MWQSNSAGAGSRGNYCCLCRADTTECQQPKFCTEQPGGGKLTPLPGSWGAGTTTVASDSTHFRSYDQNLFTEWHSRYGGRGVLIYWSVEKGSVVVHSQLLSPSASEVHAMVEGAIHHGTSME